MKEEITSLLDDLTEEPTPEQIKNAEFWIDYCLPKKCHGTMWKCLHKPGFDFHCSSCDKWY